MQLIRYKTPVEMAEAEADRVQALLAKKPTALLCLAAGHTSLPVFDVLAQRVREGKLTFSQAKFVAMDEWRGMNVSTSGSCGDFLLKNFLSKVDFQPEQVCLFDGTIEQIDGECSKILKWIDKNGGSDYLLLGIGMNGHLALNEPGVDFSASVHATALDAVTQQVGKKYFTSAPTLTGGVTIGPKEIGQAHDVALLISGSGKSEIARRLLHEPVSNLLPASYLRTLPQARICIDDEAGASL